MCVCAAANVHRDEFFSVFNDSARRSLDKVCLTSRMLRAAFFTELSVCISVVFTKKCS